MMRRIFAALLLASAASLTAQTTLPIIDMHRHASWPAGDDAAELRSTLEMMDQQGIRLSSLYINEPEDITDWVLAAPGRFIAGPMFPCDPFDTEGKRDCFRSSGGWPDPAWLNKAFASGHLRIMGEMLFVYHGTAPDDPKMEAYWSLAVKHDVPVAVHINRGPPPGGPPRYEGCCPNFNPDYGNPALLRPILKRHPNLRIQLQHAGFPALPLLDDIGYLEETIALMQDYPNVYADMSIVNSILDEDQHATALKRFIDSGLSDRIMFGSDDMPVAPILARLHAFAFLTDTQRRGILYENAARFLRLDEATMAEHRKWAETQFSARD